MPTARNGFAITVMNGKIEIIGGAIPDPTHRDGWHNSPVVEEYDPATNQWWTRGSLLTPGHAFTAVTVAGRVYLMGGDSEPNLRGVEVYDPVADQWKRAAPMPIPNGYFAAFESKGKIVALPGEPSRVWAAQEYDPATDTWRVLMTPAHTQRRMCAAAAVNGTIYTFGGDTAALGQPEQLVATTEAWAQE
jgi:N-acetylneuraminic acid mutarotase